MRRDAVGAHRLEHVERRDRVLLEVLARVLGAEADVGVGRQVEDDVGAAHGRGQRRQVERVAATSVNVASSERRLEEPFLAGREVVEGDDRVAVVRGADRPACCR